MFRQHTLKGWMVGVLTVGLLLAVSPVTAPAGGPAPFAAYGPIVGIDAGDVAPAGKSGRFLVKDRGVTGYLFGSIGDGVGEAFVFTFRTNVPLLTQSGQIHGMLLAGPYGARVVASSSLGLSPVPCAIPDGVTCFPTPAGNFVPGLLIEGTFAFSSGTQGDGTFDAWVIPVLDANGHIAGVFAGAVTLTGQWDQ